MEDNSKVSSGDYENNKANHVVNKGPTLHDKWRQIPNQIFSQTDIHIKINHWKPFGFPIFVLNTQLQTNKSHAKWKKRSKV